MVWVDISPFPPGGAISRFQVPFKVDLLPVTESEKAQWMLDVPWYNPREEIRRLEVMVMIDHDDGYDHDHDD